MNSSYQEAKKNNSHTRNDIERITEKYNDSTGFYVTTPKPNLTPVKKINEPLWVSKEVESPIAVSQYPFDLVVEELLSGTGVISTFDYDVNISLPVSFSHSGSIRHGLERLAALTNFAYFVEGNKVIWQAFVTESIVLPIQAGDYSYLIGKEGGDSQQQTGGASNNNAIDTSAFDVDRAQYSNTQSEKMNVFDDFAATVEGIVGEYGIVVASESSSSVMVKTTPDRMRLVKQYSETIIDELTAQVNLEIKVIQLISSSTSERSLDSWSFLRDFTKGQLNFLGESSRSQASSQVPSAFAASYESGKSAVDILVTALETKGDVSFVTEQSILSRSGRVAELEIGDIEGYLASVTTTLTPEIGSTTERNPAVIQSGYSLYTLNKVFGDKVAIVLSSRSSDLEPFQNIGTEDNFIQIPRLQSNRINVQQIVRSGTTTVAGYVRRTEASDGKSSPFSSRWLPTSAGSQTRTIDIFVLVTPRIVRDI